MYQDSASWVNLQAEYKESYKNLEELKKRRTGTGLLGDEVDCEIAGSMMGELSETIRELKNRSLYEYKSISEEDINNPLYRLTERQKKIALLRQRYNYYEIADMIGSDPRIIYKTYISTINKLLGLKEQEKRLNGITSLSDKQEEVYELYFKKNMKPKQIATTLNVSINTVKGYLHRIKQKTGVKIG